MKLDRQGIEVLIPHAGGMCLLDTVVDWDEKQIQCLTRSHQLPDNPLRRGDELHSLHLAEYGAQAMAVHGGLLAQAEGRMAAPGFLAMLRNLQLHCQRVDDIDGPLAVTASQLLAADSGWTYQFEVRHDNRLLADGRVTVMLQAQEAT